MSTLRLGNHTQCYHYNDISVSCITTRLVGGSSHREGRLEVYQNGTWGTVCRNSFSHAAARVVCYMCGYKDVGQYIGNRYGAGSGTILSDNVQCSGTETDIADCQHFDWGKHSCEHDEDVSVSCFSEVRLVGDSSSRGRLEVNYNGTWGTVCDHGFTDATAKLVCYSLGHRSTLDGLLVTATVPVVDEFCWTMFSAIAHHLTSQNVDTTAGAITNVNIANMFLSHVSPTRPRQSLWLEEELHELDVLKCSMLTSGEPSVMMDSLTLRQESFATLFGSAMSEEKWTLISMVWAAG